MIKKLLAPSVASSGMMQYSNGNYKKALSRLSRAYRWAPEIIGYSEFEGYLGLCLYRLGQYPESNERLERTSEYLTKVISTSSDMRRVQEDLHMEINDALDAINT